jgi:hypothetical protein
MTELRYEKPLSLPRKESKKSGLFFDRMINLENFSFLEDESMSLKEKAHYIQTYMIIHSELIDVYTNIYGEDQYYNKELVYLHIFGLSIIHKMLDLAHKINASDNPEDIALQSGYSTIQYSYGTMLSMGFEIQKKSSIYQADDLGILADSISKSVIKNKIWMEASIRETLKHQINSVIDSTSSEYIKNKYYTLIESI